MVSAQACTVADYLAELPPERRGEVERVRDLVNAAMPDGYHEVMAWGMISWVVPLERYPDTYNKQPLTYAGLAAQKKAFSLHLTCAYADPAQADKLKEAAAAMGRTLDMGKSCIRFKRADHLPLDAIRDAIAATTPDRFIALYEKARGQR